MEPVPTQYSPSPLAEQLAARITRDDLPRVDRKALQRRLSYMMLLRVILFTLLLGGTVVVHFAWGTPDQLAGPYVMVLFLFITTIYVLNIFYATLMRAMSDLRPMAVVQTGLDLLTSAVLVHFTGSAESAFVLFFLLSPIAAAITMSRRAALLTATVASALFTATVVLGSNELLPVLPGQSTLPWEVPPDVIGRSILINCGAMFAVATLSGYIADQLRFASAHVEVQQQQIDNLAALHEDVVRCLTSGLITVDPRERVLTYNTAAAEILRVPVHQALGAPLTNVLPALAQTPKKGARRIEVNTEIAGEPRVLGVSVSPLTDRNQQSIGRILNFQDLTTLRQMEASVKRSEHLAALGRVAAGVAHEIRNPLASISGSLELLQEDASVEGEERQLMSIAIREIERLDGLVGDFLTYARPRKPRLHPIDIGSDISGVVATISALLETQAHMPKINVHSEPGLWIEADHEQLTGLLWNLIRNATQAGESDVVEIRVRRARGKRVQLLVSDKGTGIEEEALGKIFEPFFTTKEKGSGLGLAIVHRIVQDHKGTVEVTSRLNRGTTFTIAFPELRDPSLPISSDYHPTLEDADDELTGPVQTIHE